jgi:tyrosine-protein phosphatase SIW14
MASNQYKTQSPAWSAALASRLAGIDCVTFSKTMEDDKSQPPTPDNSGYPVNFRVIAPRLYRSSYPQHEHFAVLGDLELKTIVTLVPEDLPLEYANFISSNGITHHHIPILANKDEKVFTSNETVEQVLALMLEPANFPMLIHCNKGKHRTGCMTACFRRTTGWPLEETIAEYVKYSEPKSRELDKAFIGRFDPTKLKPLAYDRGYIGGVYGPHLFASTQSSIYSNASIETDTTIASEVAKSVPRNDYHEKAFRQRDADLESSRLWSHK